MKNLLVFFLILLLISCSNSETNQSEPSSEIFIEDSIPGERTATLPEPLQEEEEDYSNEVEYETDTKDWDLQTSYSYSTNAMNIEWEELEKGLEVAEFEANIKCNIGDSKITVIRINPDLFAFELISTKENAEDQRPIDEWARSKGLIAAVNAGMYQTDFETNNGFMRNYDFVNNPNLNSRYNSIVAFNPKTDDLPAFQIIDLDCDDWSVLKDQYHSYTQCLRMIDCNRSNRWSQQEKYWSMVSISQDAQGNALFLFSRSPYSVHDFNRIILSAPLGVTKTMYLEGGPEASIFLDYQGKRIAKMGSFETGFVSHDNIEQFWPIPNIIGIRKKD